MKKIESIKEITDDELTYLGCSPEEYEDAIIGIAHRFGAEPIDCHIIGAHSIKHEILKFSQVGS